MNFTDFLKMKNIPDKQIPFYQNWIAQYHTFCRQYKLKFDNPKALQIFSRNLEKKFEKWQVLQAKDAIRLYKYYLSNYNQKTLKKQESGQYKQKWDMVESEMIKVLRLKQLSYRTEKSYINWLHQFTHYLKFKNPRAITQKDFRNFLSYIAVEREVSKSTQKQAFNAILFAFKYVFNKEVKDLDDAVHSHIPRKLPEVLTKQEIKDIFKHMEGKYLLMAKLIYGSGIRLQECISLRVKDIDFGGDCIIIRSGKGDKDRKTLLPEDIKEPFKEHLKQIKDIYQKDRELDISGVALPRALERKYIDAGKEWGWFWVFPSHKLSIDPISKVIRRHHIFPSTIQKAFREAVLKTDIVKRATVHTLRHSFATHLLEKGYDIRTVQALLGHANLQTTMIYTHVAKKNILGVRSPLDE